jgi:hypothetical protein
MTTERLRALWRERLRPYWHDARPTAVVAAGVAVIVLGTIGYLDKHPEFGLLDALYRAVALFGLTGNEEPPVPWTLEVARLLGPLVFGYAALRALLALFRQELRLLAIRAFARGHVVVAGLGEQGFRVATALHEAGHRVIVVERDAGNARSPGLQERGITVLTGDATDAAMLRRAQAGTAAHVVAVCGDDATNIDVAAAAERLADGRPRGVLTALAHLQDTRLWAMLAGAGVGSEQPSYRLELFNVDVLGAQALLDRHPPRGLDGSGDGPPHVLLVGLHGVGAQLVVRLAAAWRDVRPLQPGGARLRITVADAGAAEHLAGLRAAHPGLDALCELHALAAPAAPTAAPAQTYVCLPQEADALAVALDLRTIAPVDPSVVVVVADEDSGVARALRAEGRVVGGIHCFGVLTATLGADLLRHGETEVLARAKHEQYVRDELRRGTPVDSSPSLRPWDQLPDALKESNRRFADGISAKLGAARCLVVPAPLLDPAAPGFTFTDAEVEELAVQEHDRWVADLRRDGWRPTTGPKDPVRRRHPLLVPWDALGEEDRDRDREPVRAIPALLARAGFRVVRLPAADGDAG